MSRSYHVVKLVNNDELVIRSFDTHEDAVAKAREMVMQPRPTADSCYLVRHMGLIVWGPSKCAYAIGGE